LGGRRKGVYSNILFSCTEVICREDERARKPAPVPSFLVLFVPQFNNSGENTAPHATTQLADLIHYQI
jgi:hypothetical protein